MTPSQTAKLAEIRALAEQAAAVTSDWKWERGPYPDHQGVSVVVNGLLITDLTGSLHMTTGDRWSEVELGQYIAALDPSTVLALLYMLDKPTEVTEGEREELAKLLHFTKYPDANWDIDRPECRERLDEADALISAGYVRKGEK